MSVAEKSITFGKGIFLWEKIVPELGHTDEVKKEV